MTIGGFHITPPWQSLKPRGQKKSTAALLERPYIVILYSWLNICETNATTLKYLTNWLWSEAIDVTLSPVALMTCSNFENPLLNSRVKPERISNNIDNVFACKRDSTCCFITHTFSESLFSKITNQLLILAAKSANMASNLASNFTFSLDSSLEPKSSNCVVQKSQQNLRKRCQTWRPTTTRLISHCNISQWSCSNRRSWWRGRLFHWRNLLSNRVSRGIHSITTWRRLNMINRPGSKILWDIFVNIYDLHLPKSDSSFSHYTGELETLYRDLWHLF